MSKPRHIESVFLNIPYDAGFEDLYLAYIVGLSQLGLRINVTLAVPNQGRLDTILSLIEGSDFSIHDLSRVELSHGIPRFNMPLELGLALYHSKRGKKPHRVHIFDAKPYRTQRSTSDVNGDRSADTQWNPQEFDDRVAEHLPAARGCDYGARNARELSGAKTQAGQDPAERRWSFPIRSSHLSRHCCCFAH